MMSKQQLAAETILYNQYQVRGVLGEGGFGITYLAVNMENGTLVAVKEYFPTKLVFRKEDSCEICILKDKNDFLKGKKRFIEGASILMEYSYLQGIVRVWDCFECNQTAYIVMEYIDGITMREYISSHGSMEYAELIALLAPIIKSLATLHKHGIIHRDISPDNIMVGMDNQLYLIDFGAAKEVASVTAQTNTVLLKTGFAPPEQYLHDGVLGAWTDIYALCATIYTVLCGKIPTDAVARLQGKELISLPAQGVSLLAWQWDAIEKGMHIREAERFRNMEELYDALTVEPSSEEAVTVMGETETAALRRNAFFRRMPKRLGWILAAGIFLISGFLAWAFFDRPKWTGKQEPDNAATESQNTQNAEPDEDVRSVSDETSSQTETELRLCRMPGVVGMREELAKSKITAADAYIQIQIIRVYDSEVAAGVVIEQNVEPDTMYNEGALSEIVLTVSDGKSPETEKTPSASKGNKDKNEDDGYDVQSDGNEPEDFYLDD